MTSLFDSCDEKLLASGSHRVTAVADTLARMRPMMPRFGITRIADITGLDRIGIPVALAIRPNSRSVAVSQGKGETADHARASALMETIEIWHAERFDKPVLYGKARDLRDRHQFIDLERLPLVRNGQFADDLPLLWVEGVEIASSEPLLVPYEMVHADYTRPVQPCHGVFPASTNGLASGNSLLEAVNHALAEVIERDALSVWHATAPDQQKTKRLNVETITAPSLKAMIEKVTGAGLEVAFWDITSDIGVATILCLMDDPGSHDGHIGLGSGTHPDAAVALRRALTEAAQTRLNYISGARDDLSLDEFAAEGIASKHRFVREMMSGPVGKKEVADIPSQTHELLSQDLDFMMRGLAAAGIEGAAYVDLTRPDIGIHVARVIVPGLEAPHDDASYVAGPRAQGAALR
ncbi:MAG: YcaO-like family protein [Ahrensia sp.]|nr:YcaO-like family protein [Ahrensia sp.]